MTVEALDAVLACWPVRQRLLELEAAGGLAGDVAVVGPWAAGGGRSAAAGAPTRLEPIDGRLDARDGRFATVLVTDVGALAARGWRTGLDEVVRVGGGNVVVVTGPAEEALLGSAGAEAAPPSAAEVAEHLRSVGGLAPQIVGWLPPARYLLLHAAAGGLGRPQRDALVERYLELVGSSSFADVAAFGCVVAGPVAMALPLPEARRLVPEDCDEALRHLAARRQQADGASPTEALQTASRLLALSESLQRVIGDLAELRMTAEAGNRSVGGVAAAVEDQSFILERALDAALALGGPGPGAGPAVRPAPAGEPADVEAVRAEYERRLEEAHAARREAERLLRQALASESLRVGRAMTAPARWAARTGRRLRRRP